MPFSCLLPRVPPLNFLKCAQYPTFEIFSWDALSTTEPGLSFPFWSRVRSFSYHATTQQCTNAHNLACQNFFGQLKVLITEVLHACDFSCQATPPNKLALPEFMSWDRTPIRRKQHRRKPKKRRSRPTPFNYSSHNFLVTLVVAHYYLGSIRSSPDIIFSDAIIVYTSIKVTFTVINKLSFLLSSKFLNKMAHIIIGNHGPTSTPTIISLASLIPEEDPLTQLFSQRTQLSRHFLLQHRPPITSCDDLLPTTSQRPLVRSGNRHTRYNPVTKVKTFYHSRLPRHFPGKRLSRLPFSEFMNSHQAQSDTPTPPPRGAPGSASAESKECMPNAPPPHPPSLGKGTRVRRLRRQLYRQWRQLVKGNILPTAPDNALVKGGQSLRAVKRYHQQGHTTARAFKHLILRYKQKEGKQMQQQPLLTTPPLPYGTPIRIATQNVQSMAELLKHQSVLDVIQARAIDVLFLTETHATKYHQFRSQQHLFVVNGNHRDKYAGVTAVLHPRILPFLKEINQHSTRIIQVTLSVASGDIHLFGVYAPRNKHDLELVKHPFWNTLETIIAKLPLPEPVYVLGDLNVRLQGRKPDETPILGPYVYGKGRLSINNEEGSNRQLYTTLLHNHQLVDALTFKQPRLLRHVTYRDKNPPPTSWSPFVLDPMGWTQFWDKLFVLTNHEDLNLSIAYHIREFLTDVWPTDPPIPPRVDPVRFQSLDRLFTRSQWLPSIQKIGSVLSAGFPSDHYLLEAVVRVKLKSRPPKVPPPICYDYPSITQEQRYQFNQTFRRFHSNPSTTTPEINYTRKEWFIYTDGSGSNGRCSATTPAGWGFVVVEDGESIHEASGPVQTDSHSPMFLGAMVGSNNTGETSAWMEAALYILTLDQPPIAVTFTYDSKWMAQAVQGTSRPTRHKTLVKNARQILWALQQKTAVHWEWVKGHSGHEHNELADQLAEKGKSQGCCHGGRQSLPRMATVETIASPVFTPAGSVSEKYAHFVNAINRAQESTLPVLLSRPRKPWITPQVATEMERVRQLAFAAAKITTRRTRISKNSPVSSSGIGLEKD